MAKSPTDSRTGITSTSGLPQVVLPTRLAGKARSVTKVSGYAANETLRRDDRVNPNQALADLRSFQSAASMMRTLSESNGLTSTVHTSFVAMAMSGWSIQAYQTWTNEASRDGLKAAETIISGMDTLWNYGAGYQDKLTIDQVVETALIESELTMAACGELVLDTFKIPQNIALFPYESITWKSNGKGGRYAAQKDNQGNEVSLNYPTIFICEGMKPANRVYTIPFTQAGVQQLFKYETFIEDMTRVLRRGAQPRLLIELNYDKVVQSAPPDVRNSKEKLQTYLEAVRQQTSQVASDLEPEDALVYYDLAKAELAQTHGEKSDYAALMTELAGLAASALKSNPSALGLRLGGSQNVSSTEALINMKVAQLLQTPVEVLLSRALTLSVRLYGIEAYIKFKFDDIDLRPKNELEAHLQMRQARILELLSLGRVTDDEAQMLLGLGSLPEGAEELTGTGFYDSKAPDTLPVSGTNSVNNQIKTDAPTSGGGKDNAQRV